MERMIRIPIRHALSTRQVHSLMQDCINGRCTHGRTKPIILPSPKKDNLKMRLKLNVLVSSIATIALVLALALSQSTTNSTTEIHELTATEMAAITGTGTCKNSVVTSESGTDTCSSSSITCHSSSPCGTDWTHYYTNTTCSGSTIDHGPACGLIDTGTPLKTEYDCYCKNSLWPWGNGHCKVKSKDTGKAKEYQADINHDCGETTTTT